jgi:hypothetical protein
MSDTLEQVLRLVAEGKLTAAEAAPILDALSDAEFHVERARATASEARSTDASAGSTIPRPPTALRIEVTDNGRKVVNLRIPISLSRYALDRVPGLSEDNADLIRSALNQGVIGQVLQIDDGEDGVRIALE